LQLLAVFDPTAESQLDRNDFAHVKLISVADEGDLQLNLWIDQPAWKSV
jgi:hypothetical protein